VFEPSSQSRGAQIASFCAVPGGHAGEQAADHWADLAQTAFAISVNRMLTWGERSMQ